jgi:hypothetical protein
MDRSHADYKLAKRELQAIFAKLIHEASYENANTLKEAFINWKKELQQPTIAEKLNDIQQICYLGNL